jgi:hypothetical protein
MDGLTGQFKGVPTMAKGKGPGGFGGWHAVAGLACHVFQAIRHQNTCPRCRDRDLIEILLEVAHL